MVGTFPQRNLSQQILIATHNQVMDSSNLDINSLDSSNLVDINSPDINSLDTNSLVDISRDHMEHLPMGPRVL